MRTRKRELLLCAALCTTMGLSAQVDEVGTGYSAPGLEGAQAQTRAGFANSAEAKGWKVPTTTSGGDAQRRLNDVNDFIARNVAAIVDVPDDGAGVCVAVRAAKEAARST